MSHSGGAPHSPHISDLRAGARRRLRDGRCRLRSGDAEHSQPQLGSAALAGPAAISRTPNRDGLADRGGHHEPHPARLLRRGRLQPAQQRARPPLGVQWRLPLTLTLTLTLTRTRTRTRTRCTMASSSSRCRTRLARGTRWRGARPISLASGAASGRRACFSRRASNPNPNPNPP